MFIYFYIFYFIDYIMDIMDLDLRVYCLLFIVLTYIKTINFKPNIILWNNRSNNTKSISSFIYKHKLSL